MSQSSTQLAPYFFRDLADGIQQQMFFWGQDVVRPRGNFLVEQGFERSPSLGIKGTSRYRLSWKGGHIELYGACAGWYGSELGFTFIRNRRRCAIWLSGDETPIPGSWKTEFIASGAGSAELYASSLLFLDWVITYEESVYERFGYEYRAENYRKYKKVPNAKAWLEPEAALSWFRCFRDSPDQLVRPKKFIHRSYS